MTELVFFYGTLMGGFDRHGRSSVDSNLTLEGRGSINAALFDLGIYPAAIPTSHAHVYGEVYRISHPETVLQTLDEIEGFRPENPETSLYRRVESPVTLDSGQRVQAWVYYYNAPLGRAERIPSGDYLEHLKQRR